MRNIITIFLLLFTTSVVNAFSLRSLIDASVENFSSSNKDVSLIVIFQKDCQACKKQVGDLSCLGSAINIILVGAFSQEKDLRQEYLMFNTDLKAYYGDMDFLKELTVMGNFTPQILILNKNKKVKHFMGRKPCLELSDQIKKVGLL